jgi:hypothetical protein
LKIDLDMCLSFAASTDSRFAGDDVCFAALLAFRIAVVARRLGRSIHLLVDCMLGSCRGLCRA